MWRGRKFDTLCRKESGTCPYFLGKKKKEKREEMLNPFNYKCWLFMWPEDLQV